MYNPELDIFILVQALLDAREVQFAPESIETYMTPVLIVTATTDPSSEQSIAVAEIDPGVVAPIAAQFAP